MEKPYLVVESHFDRVTLLFNKFGDPDTACYRVYGGLDPQPKTLIAISDKTLLDLKNLENNRRYYFRVTAVDRDGRESPFSNEESTVVYLYDPNQAGREHGSQRGFLRGPDAMDSELRRLRTGTVGRRRGAGPREDRQRGPGQLQPPADPGRPEAGARRNIHPELRRRGYDGRA